MYSPSEVGIEQAEDHDDDDAEDDVCYVFSDGGSSTLI